MKKILRAFSVSMALFLSSCKEYSKNKIVFATSAEYPPFEFHENDKIKGFDIELAILIAREMKKEAKFEDMQFSSILAALQNGSVDAAISTLTITQERKKNFDFSDSYYEESMSVIYLKGAPLKDRESLKHKKIACQLGTTMEIWLRKNVPSSEVICMNNNNQAVEALKAGHVDGVLIDSVQAVSFSSKNPGLSYEFIAKSENGYGIAVKKGSKLKEEINNALKALQQKGEINKLKKKWLESVKWKN
jgi:polar amino acid transport system substrate-binding protein